MGLVLAACAAPQPSEISSPAASRAETSSPTASPAPIAETLPEPSCEEPPDVFVYPINATPPPVVAWTCEDAVRVAAAILPLGHRPIISIEFHYGFYCPSGWSCPRPLLTGREGYVTFWTAPASEEAGIWVRVVTTETGQVRVASGPDPFPPATVGGVGTAAFLPDVSPPPAMLDTLGSIVILRAYSGKFSQHKERTLLAQPQVVVFDDGTVVANVALVSDPPDYRTISLTEQQMTRVTDSLQVADLKPLAAGRLGGGDLCYDCATTIIRTDIGGPTIEIAAEGLQTGNENWERGMPYGAGLIATDRLLNELVDLVRAGSSEPYSGALPQIPVAPIELG